jgi:hypothetical protein
MIFRELNCGSKCKTYLIGSEVEHAAPVGQRV